jgi:hypothetical protein
MTGKKAKKQNGKNRKAKKAKRLSGKMNKSRYIAFFPSQLLTLCFFAPNLYIC